MGYLYLRTSERGREGMLSCIREKMLMYSSGMMSGRELMY